MKPLIITLSLIMFSLGVSSQAYLRVTNNSPYDIEFAIVPEDNSCFLNVSNPYTPLGAGLDIQYNYAYPIVTISTVRFRAAGCSSNTSVLTLGNPCGACPTTNPINGTFERTTLPGGCPAPDYTFFADWYQCSAGGAMGEISGIVVY